MDTLIVVTNTEVGINTSLRGMRNAMRAVVPPPIPRNFEHDDEGMPDTDQLLRKVEIWSCEKADVPLIVEEISKYHTGVEIKIYSLNEVFTRLPGELKSLTVTKDGKLPF